MGASSPTTRRALFGVAAAVALATPVASIAAPSPDAALFALNGEWEAALRDSEKCSQAVEAASEVYNRIKPAVPDVLTKRYSDWGCLNLGDGDNWANPADIKRVRSALESQREIFREHGINKGAVARCEEIIAAYERWKPANLEAISKSRLMELLERDYALGIALNDLEMRILATPASTLDGLRIKAKIAARRREDGDGLALASLLSDLGVKEAA